jgi:hypothetical protein
VIRVVGTLMVAATGGAAAYALATGGVVMVSGESIVAVGAAATVLARRLR